MQLLKKMQKQQHADADRKNLIFSGFIIPYNILHTKCMHAVLFQCIDICYLALYL